MANRCSDRSPRRWSLPPERGSDAIEHPSAPGNRLVASGFGRKILTIACIAMVAAGAAAQSPDRAPAADGSTRQAEALAKRAAERLTALQREAESLATRERSLLADLRKLEVERAIRVEELARLQRDTRTVEEKRADATARASRLQQEAHRQRPDVEARLVQVYKMGR